MNEIAPAASCDLGMRGDGDESLGAICGEGGTTDGNIRLGVGVRLDATAKRTRNADAKAIGGLESEEESFRSGGRRCELTRSMKVRFADESREGERKIREGGEVAGL